MTANDLASLQELLELKLDALAKSLEDSQKALKESQDRFEKEFKSQLERIELQTTATNGRVTKLEMKEYTKAILEEERQHTHDEKIANMDRWGGWFKPVVTGVVMALIIAISNIDKL